MMSDFDRLLRPKSIAIIGGGAWCENVLEQCEKIGFDGQIWPIHPKKSEILGHRAFANLHDLPHAPDAAFIGVNRNTTIEVVSQLRQIGCGGAICFASGFQEAQNESADGTDLQSQLVQAAGEMKIIGPNCYGLVNYLDGAALWPDQHGGLKCDSGVAIITQSSNIAINLTMQKRGLPIAYIVTAGNQAQTGLSEIGMAMLEDPRVTALGLHIEGIDDLRKFEALAAKAATLEKRILALKIGSSEQAQTAAISHTASLSGSDAGANALLKRLGIGRVDSLSALLETLKLLHVAGPLKSGAIASMSCSGGEASLFADSIGGTSLAFPPLNSKQETDLRDALGSMVALANPLDYHTYIWNDRRAMAQTFSAMMDPQLSVGCIVVDFPRTDRCSAEDWELVIEAAREAKTRRGVPIALLATMPENMPEDVAARIMEQGLIPFCGMTEAIQAMDVAARLSECSEEPLLLPRKTVDDETLSEFEAKKLLSRFGVMTPNSNRAASIKDLPGALLGLSFPVALKGEGVAHKSDAGAVVLNLNDELAVSAAAMTMPANGFLVEEMIGEAVCELLLGVVCDRAHGYVLTIAAGGVMTEILKDRTSVLIPASRNEIEASLMSLKINPLLTGFRGFKPANMDAILDAAMALQEFVMAHPVIEAEINPLICTTDRAVACDALIKIGHLT
jgi:acyl-CoA synthetase (NDP forming)